MKGLHTGLSREFEPVHSQTEMGWRQSGDSTGAVLPPCASPTLCTGAKNEWMGYRRLNLYVITYRSFILSAVFGGGLGEFLNYNKEQGWTRFLHPALCAEDVPSDTLQRHTLQKTQDFQSLHGQWLIDHYPFFCPRIHNGSSHSR
jgi:hypothetical protein